MTAADYRVRAATDADSAAVRELVFDICAEFGLSPDADGDDADLEAVASAYADSGGWFELLLRGSRLLGTIGMMPIAPGVLELRKMYFRPEVRGHGLGKALLARNLARARASGFDEVTLETATVLEAARALYARFGFVLDRNGVVACGKGCDQVWRLCLDTYREPATPMPRLMAEEESVR